MVKLADLEANLKINNLDLSHIHLTNVDSALIVKDKTLKLTRLHANLYDNGIIDGTAVIKVNHDAYDVSIDNQVSNVDLKRCLLICLTLVQSMVWLILLLILRRTMLEPIRICVKFGWYNWFKGSQWWI